MEHSANLCTISTAVDCSRCVIMTMRGEHNANTMRTLGQLEISCDYDFGLERSSLQLLLGDDNHHHEGVFHSS